MNPASPFRRMLVAHWALALALALSLLAGALTLDDYGDGVNKEDQRAIGSALLDYLAGDGERAFDRLHFPWDRYYGAVFEAPLILIERILDLEGGDIRLGRHLLMHLFFLTGGVFCYLLALRMFGSRALALVATALFLLHPRIYAHSFFNSKDIPFLVAFMIALYLLHRAFRRDTLGAFLLCGVGVGLLLNLRIMGVVLFVAVLALRALDLAFTESADERRRVLLTGGAFALAALLTYHASLPALWTDPFGGFAELVRTLSDHPNAEYSLFRGQWLYTPDGPPFDYVPVWVGITTPPATLLLAMIGAVTLAWRALRHPRHILRNGPLRFGLLLAALPVATTIAVVVLESSIQNGWRHLYFLYAPVVLLAAFGLWRLASVQRGRWARTGAYALTGAAVAVTIASMIRIHPHQNSHFNSLVDRTTPERLTDLYTVTLWKSSGAPVFDDIRRDHPTEDIFLSLNHVPWYSATLPVAETQDFRSGERNFYATHPWGCLAPAPAMPLYVTRVYAATLHCVVEPVAWFGGYRREARATEPLVRSRFDVHRVGDVLVYVRDDCSVDDMGTRFFLRIHPVVPSAPSGRPGEFLARQYGFHKLDFAFTEYGARIDGDCVAVVPLPDYPIARIETGRFTPERAVAAFRAVAGDEPLARSRFDVWRAAGRGLVYAREECDAEDAEARFFLHVTPRDDEDLPDWPRREGHDFENLDFWFPQYGVRTGAGGCIATVPLPAYPIARIETGQFDGTGQIWQARFAFALPEIDAEALAGEPLARSVYDIHRDGEALVYVRDGCTDAEADAPFFLHVIPMDEGDLPGHRREYGFDNLDFTLATHGARRDGNCIAVAHLPGYAIATVRTGQFDDTGRLWTAEFALPDGE